MGFIGIEVVIDNRFGLFQTSVTHGFDGAAKMALNQVSVLLRDDVQLGREGDDDIHIIVEFFPEFPPDILVVK